MIKITGSSDLDIDLRTDALEVLNTLPTEILTRLVELSQSKKARNYLSTSNGFATVKAFLGT